MASAARVVRKVVVVAPQGIHCDALVSFLRALPSVQVAAVLHDPLSLLSWLASGPGDVAVLDGAIAGGEIGELVRRIGRANPSLHTIVLAEGAAQAEQCLAAGAADVLLKGWLDERLAQMVIA